jgi:inorganic pyrophosphatase
VTTYIEIVPADTIKYELDKATGILKVDRPQSYSNICPTLYGLIPQTYCADQVAELCGRRTSRTGIRGDGDPLDVCVLTEKSIPRGDILVPARPIGGLRVIDNNEADDKIIAVMEGDAFFGGWREIADCPAPLVNRLKHYFLTYKEDPNTTASPIEIAAVYDATEAREVIDRARTDYAKHFPDVEGALPRPPGG